MPYYRVRGVCPPANGRSFKVGVTRYYRASDGLEAVKLFRLDEPEAADFEFEELEEEFDKTCVSQP